MFVRRPLFRGSLLVVALLASHTVAAELTSIALTQLDLTQLQLAGWSAARVDQSFASRPLSVGGQKFQHGLGTRATTTLWLELDGAVDAFSALVGVDDAAGAATAAVRFRLIGDGRDLWDSGVMKRGDAAKPLRVALHGVHSLLLTINHAGETKAQNLADLIDAEFRCGGTAPKTVNAPQDDAGILTPKPGPAPRLNLPARYGCRPGNPFIFRVPTTGERPMQFAADGLPMGLRLDAASGIITGTAPARGTHVVQLRVTNRHGKAAAEWRIESGDTLALTPPMGWNSWYAHYNRITDAMMREAADILVASGMADVGYAYVNIDDCWMNALPDAKRRPDPQRIGPFRDAAGNILPNADFPDMRGMTDHIHGYGLKAGIYSSPGPLTCAGYSGSHEHEEQDARQFAAWGFDFLKYDWCSYSKVVNNDRTTRSVLQKPYQQMGDILRRLPRDVQFNLCQYGMGDVWEWGAEVGGQSWRTGGDLGGELNQMFPVALANARHREWSRPGAWNDPDYIQIGFIGLARTNGEPRPCPLTRTEQYSFMSLWSLMAAPLFYSGDLTRLDDFTLNVLCNPEVIAINQDSLGESARVAMLSPETFIMVKTLADGSRAIGLCNGDEVPREITAVWRDLGLSGSPRLRDVWRQRDIGTMNASYSAVVPRHGVILLRVTGSGTSNRTVR